MDDLVKTDLKNQRFRMRQSGIDSIKIQALNATAENSTRNFSLADDFRGSSAKSVGPNAVDEELKVVDQTPDIS